MKKLLFLLVALSLNANYFVSLTTDKPKYAKDFKHFEYVNPNAKKGGVLRMAAIGGFDSLNQFILKGKNAAGLGLLYDTLMTPSEDEQNTYYPLIAKDIDIAKDNSYVIFTINKKARFHDGAPITAQDVKFTFDLLLSKASPFYKRYYKEVKKAIVLDKYRVKFTFSNKQNKELPTILSQLSVLPKHFWKGKDFLKSSAIVPLGNSAYKISKYKYGKFIEFERDKDYWAKDLPTQKGRFNYDRIRFDYYKDSTVTLEAFLSGEYSLRIENTAKNWAVAYKNASKNIKRINIPNKAIPHFQNFVFNTRKDEFKDINTRMAISNMFNFEWINKNLFYGQYKRVRSIFQNSQLEAKEMPQKDELELLNQIKAYIPKSVFENVFKPSSEPNDRKRLRKSLALLQKAGYKLKGGKLIDKKGKQLSFEILLVSPSLQKLATNFQKSLERLGIKISTKIVDPTTYITRVQNFNYDMIIGMLGFTNSPGNELYNYFYSTYKDTKGGKNLAGVSNKGVDFLIEKIVSAESRKDLVLASKALDRIMMHMYYFVPQYYSPNFRIAVWDIFEFPKVHPRYSIGVFNWSINEAKQKKLGK